jgi:hypothetical protein
MRATSLTIGQVSPELHFSGLSPACIFPLLCRRPRYDPQAHLVRNFNVRAVKSATVHISSSECQSVLCPSISVLWENGLEMRDRTAVRKQHKTKRIVKPPTRTRGSLTDMYRAFRAPAGSI